MLCKECPHFRITVEPWPGVDFGHAVCDKYQLIVDFITRKKFDTLECAEECMKGGST